MSYPSYQPDNSQYTVPPPVPGYPPVAPPPTQQMPTQQMPAQQVPAQQVPAQQVPAQQVSEYPAQPPVSGPAAPGFLTGALQNPSVPYGSTPNRRGTTTLVLALVAGLFFVLGGVGFGLYVDKRGELRDTKAALATRTSEMQTQQKLVAEQTAKTAEVEKRANDLNGQLTKTRASLTDVTKDRNALLPCMRRIQETFQALRDGSLNSATKALNRAETACDRAETTVDS